jgi:hypothetical protein
VGLIDMLLQKFISLLSFDPPENKAETHPNTGVRREVTFSQQKPLESSQDTEPMRQRIKDRRKSRCSPNIVQPKQLKGTKPRLTSGFSYPMPAELTGKTLSEISPDVDTYETSSEISPLAGKTDGDEMKPLTESLGENLGVLKKILHYGTNADVVVREFDIPTERKTTASIIFMDGLVARDAINLAILQPLMLIANLGDEKETEDHLEFVKRKLLPGNQVTERDNFRSIIEDVLSGVTCLIIDGSDIALSIETRAWEHRGRETLC